MKRALFLAALCGAAGCSELPEVEYHRDGFDLAVEFDHPVCEGTLLAMEDRVNLVERETGMDHETPMLIYWLAGELERICPRPVSGCFIPGTQIVASTGRSLHHEIVHAVLNTRGSNPFAEEGLAEALSGVAVHQSVGERRNPLEALGQTRKDARAGNLDYDQAAHFMHFVRSESGPRTIASLADAIDRGDSPDRFVSLLEREFGLTGQEIERAYAKAPDFYAGGSSDGDTVGEFGLVAGINLSLDCKHEATFGPISEDYGGMYHLLRIDSGDVIEGTLKFTADPGVQVSLFREVDPEGAWVQDWWSPDPGLDPAHLDLEPGQQANVRFSPGNHWLLMVRSRDSSAPKGAHLQLTL